MAQQTNRQPPYPWQQTCWRQFQMWMETKTLPHAVLLTGPSGLGQQAFVLQAVAYLLCEHGSACGNCRSCGLWQANSHPDWINLDTSEQGGSIGVDVIRSMVSRVSQTSHSAHFRITIIHPAENMTLAANNALLKTLEEPPPHAIFFLISYNIAALPATVRSRCHQLKFPIPSQDQLGTWQSIDQNHQMGARLAICDDLPLVAQEEGDDVIETHQGLLENLNQLKHNQTTPTEIFTHLSHLTLMTWIHHFQKIIIDGVRIKLGVSLDALYYLSGQAITQSLFEDKSLAQLFNIYDHINEKRAEIQSGMTFNAQLLIEGLLLTLARLNVE